MNGRPAVIATAALIGLFLPLTSPASAAPQRACPPPFELLTYEQQVELARQVTDSDEEAKALADETIARVDKNGDLLLCFAFQNKSKGAPNVIDNTARRPH
jgi:hypothetical protein